MAFLTIDGTHYDMDKLSDEAKAKVSSAQACEQKIAQLEAELAMIRTARSAYLASLSDLLDDSALAAPSAPAKKAAPKKAAPKKTAAKKAAPKKTAAKKPAAKTEASSATKH